MSKTISPLSKAMVMWHLNYSPSKIWNEEEKKEWNKLTLELQQALLSRKTDKYEAEMKRFIAERLTPLATTVAKRYVLENNIVSGLENVPKVIFADPNRKIELTPIGDDAVAVTEIPEEKKEESATEESKAE